MTRRAAKVDANHNLIVAALRTAGASVQSLAAVGHGVPDILVGIAGETYLLEIKDGSKPASQRKLTDDQTVWHSTWRGKPVVVVETEADALRAINR